MLRLLTLRSFSRPGILYFSSYSSGGSYKNEHGSSYYLIPEIPSESYVSTNILKPLDVSNLEELKPDGVFGGVSKLIMNYQVSLSKLSDNIQKGEISKNDATIISALEEASFPVEQAFANLNCLNSIKKDPIWGTIISRLYQKLKVARYDYFYRDSSIFEALLTLRRSASKLDEYEKGLLDVWIYDCWLMGTGLMIASNKSGKMISFSELNNIIQEINNSTNSSDNTPHNVRKSLETIHDLYTDIEKEEAKFHAMVVSTAVVSLPKYYCAKYTGRVTLPSSLEILTGETDVKIAESDLAPSAPYWLPAVLGGKEDGGHIAGMHLSLVSNNLVLEFLRHCCTSEVRKTVWEYWVRRASCRYFGPTTGLHASNDQRIQDIRRLRKSLAKYLGCKDWLSVVWSSPYSHSPSSPDQLVTDVLEPFRSILKEVGEREFKLLKEWANANLDIYGKTLEPWDVEYALEQYNYAVLYTRLEKVITPPDGSLTNYLHTVFSELANIFHFKLIPQISRSSVRKDICYVVEKLVYHVEDASNGTLLGKIIIDPFARSNRSTPVGGTSFIHVATRDNLAVNDIRVHSESSHYPIVYILGSLNESTETLGISFNVLLSLMHVFGSCLQLVSCRVPHHELYRFPHYIALDTRYLMGDLCFRIGYEYALPSLKQYLPNINNNNQKPYFQQCKSVLFIVFHIFVCLL
ncbi:subfamily M3A non-peptidase (M03 family) isoform 2 [Schistosoma japonicum]|uniref:Subfamily M3A non-peptidase (M03 family) isoform 2 n=1 Tax=Schistosoma japonicum TaxID=6182 RepID=A0A4Z2DCC7_SCHJA|nr:subfamily M3A non-peptidase (M03 family) isoform 2 [Schistosoma japonicum]